MLTCRRSTLCFYLATFYSEMFLKPFIIRNLYLGNEKIDIVQNYTYLGTQISSTGNFTLSRDNQIGECRVSRVQKIVAGPKHSKKYIFRIFSSLKISGY